MNTTYLGSRFIKDCKGNKILVYLIYSPEEYLDIKGWIIEVTSNGWEYGYAVGTLNDAHRCLRTALYYNRIF